MNNENVIEEWRDIEQAPNYEVSNLGNVRHKKRKQNRSLKNQGGYKAFSYRENGKVKTIYVHIAVAKAFIPNPFGLPQVSHIDESRDNNKATNLKWATGKENCNMPEHLKRLSVSRGIPVVCVETGVIYHSGREAARQLGLRQSGISRCCNNENATAGGYHFRFAV